MISIKFKRQGQTKDKLFYSIIVISNKSTPNSGKFIEKLGHYKPSPKWDQKILFVNFDRLCFWLNKGAKMSKSLYILIRPLVIYFKKKNEF